MQFRLIVKDGRQEIYRGNTMRGYVDDDTLFAIGQDGYAVKVGEIGHSSEATEKLETWFREKAD